MITAERIHDGTLVLSALVSYSQAPWHSRFYHRRKYQGYTLTEAKSMFRDSLTRDGLVIVKD